MEHQKYLFCLLAVIVSLVTGCAGPTTKQAGIDQSIVEAEKLLWKGD